MPVTREALLVRTFVSLADSLVVDYDVIELLQTLVDNATELFDASASGITLGPDEQNLNVIVSSNDGSHLAELMQSQVGEGPCVEAVASGELVTVENTADIRSRWPAFAQVADEVGFVSVHAMPLRLRDDTIGSLNLFRDREGPLNEADAIAARGLADVATIGILQQRAIRDGDVVQRQLQKALDSRVVIEQAKGVLAHRYGLDMDRAYRLLRHHARSSQTAVASVAAGVVDGSVTIPLTHPAS